MRLKEGWEGGESRSLALARRRSAVQYIRYVYTQVPQSSQLDLRVPIYSRLYIHVWTARRLAPVQVICRASSHIQCVA